MTRPFIDSNVFWVLLFFVVMFCVCASCSALSVIMVYYNHGTRMAARHGVRISRDAFLQVAGETKKAAQSALASVGFADHEIHLIARGKLVNDQKKWKARSKKKVTPNVRPPVSDLDTDLDKTVLDDACTRTLAITSPAQRRTQFEDSASQHPVTQVVNNIIVLPDDFKLSGRRPHEMTVITMAGENLQLPAEVCQQMTAMSQYSQVTAPQRL